MGGIIVLTNTRTLLHSDWIAAGGAASTVTYVVLYAVWGAALAHSVREHRRSERLRGAPEPARTEDATPANY